MLACSTADGLDTSGGAGTGDGPVSKPQPALDGSECGSDTYGWRTACSVSGQITYENPLAPGDYLDLDPYVGPTTACCEGKPSTETADFACLDACMAELCGMAESIYDDIAQENGWNCNTGCRFDLDGCLAGIPVQQFPHPPGGDDYPHEVTVSCAATNVEPRQPDGTFDFIDLPLNYMQDDPPTCGEPYPMAGLDSLGSLVANSALDDAGTYAMATWWTSTAKGQHSSSEVAVAVDYHLRPCAEGECLELTRFDASAPAGLHAGLDVQSADLTLVAITDRPVVDHTGAFRFPAGSLHFVLKASVGGIPLSIVRTNATPAVGRVSHAADLFELTNLWLHYEDGELGADLRIDLVGSHVNRAPQAAIRRLHTPFACNEPVAFEAASVDPDDHPMRHYWWAPGGMSRESSMEAVLAAGEHRIILLSVDARGAHDVTALDFTRRCS